MKLFLKATIALVTFGFVPLEADAGSRYAKRPALSVGTNLSSPWTLQLKPKRRHVSRATVARVKRPRSLRPARTSDSRKFKVYRRQPGTIRTASVAPRSQRLRSSITPDFKQELLPTIVDYYGSEKPGTLVINTPERRLYLVMEGGRARRYAIGVGKPGFEWAGSHKVSRKAEWPDWRPPAEMIEREKKKGRTLPKFMAGGPKNPLGARALYLGSTIYRIHGTNQAWSIGKAVSSGCIRMRNEDVMDLYDRIPVGTRVNVI